MYTLCREIADYEIEAAMPDKEKVMTKEAYKHNIKELKETYKLQVERVQDRVDALDRLQGHLYEYPLKFLQKDVKAGNLKPSLSDAEGVIPAMTFT